MKPKEGMKHRLLLAIVGATLLLSACAVTLPVGDEDICHPPAYCGSGKTYNARGQG
jgi:hypothetical protein